MEEDYKQSNKARRAEDEVEDSGCNDNLNWRDPKVIKVQSCIVKTADIVGHQVNYVTNACIMSYCSLAQ